MPKKQNLEDLLNNVPSPSTLHAKIISFLMIFLFFSVFAYFGIVTWTGLTVSDLSQPQGIIQNQNILVSNKLEIFSVDKTPNSVLNVNFKSDVLVNVLIEMEDCSYWRNGQDRDNTVLYSINNINEGNFRIGDPSENTIQQVDLYKASDLCLIFINKEFPNVGNVNLQYQEAEVNLWRIV